MKSSTKGHSFLIPRNRRLSWDLLYFHKSVPLCSHDYMMSLQPADDARRECKVRISWPAIFLKAFGLVSAEIPELRQIWYRWPFAHIYEHPNSTGILTVHRQYKNQPWLFWAKIPQPENAALQEIQASIDGFTSAPPKSIFRDQIKLAALPSLVRRVIWGWNIHFTKAKRANNLGTFFVSTLSGKGVEIQQPPSIQTACLTYGPVHSTGVCRVTLAYDHRIMDGVLAAKILKRLEQVILETVRPALLQIDESKGIISDVA